MLGLGREDVCDVSNVIRPFGVLSESFFPGPASVFPLKE